jgi:hypothetical protein
MKFVTILVEGQTEETFMRDVLNSAYPSLQHGLQITLFQPL